MQKISEALIRSGFGSKVSPLLHETLASLQNFFSKRKQTLGSHVRFFYCSCLNLAPSLSMLLPSDLMEFPCYKFSK